jgi:hypothetical protein
MMPANDFSYQVDAFHDWKGKLVNEITHYQQWLQDCGLYSDDLGMRLTRGLSLLKDNQLTIAMVGEYSRGKTELINALLFSGFGQRILPSQAGRTTMCPTEIFYDTSRTESYLKLLPIETRMENLSIQALKQKQDVWHEISIDTKHPEQMIESLKQLAMTRLVSVSDARSLGFDEHMLERDPVQTDSVCIPVWRHALISLDNPILKKGIRILDTPGLNALGSEPELTISMIPRAQAVIFALSADTGVTASDLEIWERYIKTDDSDHRAGRFAVLNKIDVLWDDLEGEAHVAESIEKVRQKTAGHLGIDVDDIIPLSAKQGLIARVKKDNALLKKSALPSLEKIISKRILSQKETFIVKDLVSDIQKMLHGSQSILNERLARLYENYDDLESEALSPEVLKKLADKTHLEHETYYKKLLTLKSSRRLMESQGEILQQLMSHDRFKVLLKQAKRDLQDSWSTVGMIHTMNQFFAKMDKELVNVEAEARLADKMVAAIYKRFKSDTHAKYLKPKTFSIVKQRQELKLIRKKLMQYCRQPKMFMTEQSVLIHHFFNTFATEVKYVQEQVTDEAKKWPDEALLPLMQYVQEQKNMLEEHVKHLREMASSTKNVKVNQAKLKKLINQIHQQLNEAETIQQQLEVPPPSKSIGVQDIAIR